MKTATLLTSLLTTVLLTSCYEGDDLEDAYGKRYEETEIKNIKIENVTYSSATVTFQLLNAKLDADLCLFYIDNMSNDPIEYGTCMHIDLPEQESVYAVSQKLTLTDLTSGTNYCIRITYSDPGHHELQSGRLTFKTR